MPVKACRGMHACIPHSWLQRQKSERRPVWALHNHHGFYCTAHGPHQRTDCDIRGAWAWPSIFHTLSVYKPFGELFTWICVNDVAFWLWCHSEKRKYIIYLLKFKTLVLAKPHPFFPLRRVWAWVCGALLQFTYMSEVISQIIYRKLRNAESMSTFWKLPYPYICFGKILFLHLPNIKYQSEHS